MRKKKGQAILEVALALPIVLLLFCGIVDFGRILQASSHLNMVSQEAARIAGLGGNDSEIFNFIREEVILKDKNSIVENIEPRDYYRNPDANVTLAVSYEEVIFKDKDSIEVKITPRDYYRDPGDYVTLEISYPIKYITPLMGTFLPSPYVVDTQATIRVE